MLPVKPFSPHAIDLSDQGFDAYPFEGRVESLLSQSAPKGWKPTTCTRDLYLDISERIVEMAASWLDQKGAIIDPVTGEEWNQTTPRFVSSAAVLIYFGRSKQHLDAVCRAMAYCAKRMANGEAHNMSPDFWMRELMTADMCLDGIAPKHLQEAWRDDLRKINCEKLYNCVDPEHGPKLKTLHNWTIYASGGEALRELANLGPKDRSFVWGRDFFDIYMKPQLAHMTDHGMYRDPNDPITYDITTRLQFTIPLAYGFESPLREAYLELQRRGCLTALLFASADGYVPYGGRSSQFNFQEIILSAMFELEAQRYKSTNLKLAGAFKQQAHLGAQATRRWLMDMEPLRHIKNGFDPATRHGTDSYGQYSVYSLLTSSFLGLAALFADDSIAESPAPSELAGYVVELPDAFHKIFAAVRNSYVEIDTAADLQHDATGIGRVHFSGTPLEMVMGMPFTDHPKYNFAPGEQPPHQPLAIAPTWQTAHGRIALASLTDADVSHTTEILKQSPQQVAFTVRYEHAQSQSQVDQTCTLMPDALTIQTHITVAGKPASQVIYQIPVLIGDGQATSQITVDQGKMSGEYRGFGWEILWDPKNAHAIFREENFANRNARYRLLELDFGSSPVMLTIGHVR